MSTINKVISFRGYINGERKSSPELSKIVSELLDNCYESFRINKSGGKIIVNFRVDRNILKSIQIIDIASDKTGITDIDNIFKLYSHSGDTTGWSEYGIGGTKANILLGDNISYTTVKKGKCEKITLSISESLERDDLVVFKERGNPDFLPEGFKSGTLLEINDITQPYRRMNQENIDFFIESINNLYVETPDNIKTTINFKNYRNGSLINSDVMKDKDITQNYQKVIRFNIYSNGDEIKVFEQCEEKEIQYFSDRKSTNLLRRRIGICQMKKNLN